MGESVIMAKEFEFIINKIVFLTCFFTLFVGCAEQNPSKIQDKKEDNISERDTDSRILNITSDLSSPQLVGVETLDNNTINTFDGVYLQSYNSLNIINWRVMRNYDLSLGAYNSGSSSIFLEDMSNSWLPILPFPLNEQSNIIHPILLTNSESAEMFSAWINSDVIYVNQYLSTTGWQAQQVLGVGERLYLSKDDIANPAIVWVNNVDTNRFELNASVFKPDSGWGNASTLTRPNAEFIVAGDPIVDELSGEVVFVWLEKSDTGFQHLLSSSVDINKGWSNVIPVKQRTHYTQGDLGSIYLVKQADAAHMVLYYSYNTKSLNGIYVANLEKDVNNNMKWGLSTKLDVNNDPNIQNGSLFRYHGKSNNNGDIVIAWLTTQYLDFTSFYRVQARRYSPITGWTFTESLSNPLSLNDSIPTVPTPIVSLDQTGSSTIIWSEVNENISQLVFSTFDGATSTWSKAEVFVKAATPDTFLDWANVTYTSTGKLGFVWVEEKSEINNTIYEIWAMNK